MQQPKHISEYAMKTVCFYMFVDEETESYLRNSSMLDSNKRTGLWRIVVVRNLPYKDARRTGKVIQRVQWEFSVFCFSFPRILLFVETMINGLSRFAIFF